MRFYPAIRYVLLTSIIALVLSGCGNAKCKPEGLETHLLKQMGFIEVDAVHGLRPLGDYEITLDDFDLLNTNSGRHVCKATLEMNGTIGEEWKGIRRARHLNTYSGVDRILERIGMGSSGRTATTQDDREISKVADLQLPVSGKVTYSVDVNSGELIAFEQGQNSLIENWVSKVNEIRRGVAIYELGQKVAKDDKTARDAGYKSAIHMQVSKKLEAAEKSLANAQSKLAEADKQLKAAIQRRDNLIARLKVSSFGDGNGLVQFDSVKVEVRPKPFYPDDPVYYVIASGKQLQKPEVNILGFDAILYSPSAGFLHLTDGALSLGNKTAWRAETQFAGYGFDHLECCDKTKVLFAHRDWQMFLHVKSASRSGNPGSYFPALKSPDVEVQELNKVAQAAKANVAAITKDIQELKQKMAEAISAS